MFVHGARSLPSCTALTAIDRQKPVERVDLLEIAEDVAVALQSSAEEKNVRVSVTGEGAANNGVRGFLHEMIYNLCDNAVRYNAEGAVWRSPFLAAMTALLLRSKTPALEYQSRVFERFSGWMTPVP